MKIISKILALSLVCFMMVCLCGCELIEDNDDGKKKELTLWEMRGTWTTVGCSNVPSSMNSIWLAHVSFWLDTDYDGGERWYDIWSREIGDCDDVNLNGSTIERYDSPILDIISYKESIMDVRLFRTSTSSYGGQEDPELPNVIFTMKKLGSAIFNDDDYKFKLTNGIWLKYDSEDAACEAYSNDDYELKSMAKGYGGGRLINFHQDGTGEFAYYSNRIYNYKFKWQLKDKVLTIQVDGKEERQSKVTLVSVEGEIHIRFETDVFWG